MITKRQVRGGNQRIEHITFERNNSSCETSLSSISMASSETCGTDESSLQDRGESQPVPTDAELDNMNAEQLRQAYMTLKREADQKRDKQNMSNKRSRYNRKNKPKNLPKDSDGNIEIDRIKDVKDLPEEFKMSNHVMADFDTQVQGKLFRCIKYPDLKALESDDFKDQLENLMDLAGIKSDAGKKRYKRCAVLMVRRTITVCRDGSLRNLSKAFRKLIREGGEAAQKLGRMKKTKREVARL